MKKLEMKYWVAFGLLIVGLVFIFWGAHIYLSYPGLKELMKIARHTAILQYGIGVGCFVVSWIIYIFFIKKHGRRNKI